MALFKTNYSLSDLWQDTLGGTTAMFVALPLAVAYGVVAGLGAAAGLYGAVAVGFFTAVFGGTSTQISGPTAPMAIIMAVIVTDYSSTLSEALMIVMLAGVMQMVIGLLKLGRFVAYTPYVVVASFMSAIGILVMAIQVLPMLGSAPASGGVIGMLLGLPDALATINYSALAIGCATLGVAIVWPGRLHRYLPPTLAGLAAGTALGVLWLGDAPVLGPVPTTLMVPDLTLPSINFVLDALQPALLLASIGSIVSLLTALAADSLTRTSHDPERELVSQGLGNLAAGLIGGLPGAGTPVYTVANIRAGGRTRVSGLICALLLLALLLGLAPYADPIPLAALAGVLFKVGWDLVDWSLLTRLRRLRGEYAVTIVVTTLIAVIIGPIMAVVLGMIISFLAGALRVGQLELDSVISVPLLDSVFLYDDDEPEDADPFSARVGMLVLKGNLTVASSKKLVRIISIDLLEHEVVILDFAGVTFMDDSAATVVRQLIDLAANEGTPTIVTGSSGEIAETLDAFDVLHSVPGERIVEDQDQARGLVRQILGLDPA